MVDKNQKEQLDQEIKEEDLKYYYNNFFPLNNNKNRRL